jgi:hypothetical protein
MGAGFRRTLNGPSFLQYFPACPSCLTLCFLLVCSLLIAVMERVQFQQEQMLAELKDLEQKGLFSQVYPGPNFLSRRY